MPNPESPKFIPPEELTPEEGEKIGTLEIDTNELYRQKVELNSVYDKIRDYVPELTRTVTDEEGKEIQLSHKANWRDLAKMQAEGELEGVIEEKLEQELAGEKSKDLKIQRRLRARKQDIERGLALFGEIEQREGKMAQAEDDDLEQQTLKQYKWFRLREFAGAKKEIKVKESEMEENRLEREDAVEQGDVEDIHFLNDEYRRLEQELGATLESSPEAFMYLAGRQIKEAKEVFDEHGTIVETPYVKEKMRRILDVIQEGRPVFIHGETGTGKTELAKHLTRRILSGAYLKRWEKENPKPTNPKEIEEREARKKSEAEILEVRGLRSLEKEDLLAKTLIEREEVPEPEVQVDFFNQAWEGYKKTVLEPAAERIEDPLEKKKFLERGEKQLEKGYFEKWRANVKTIEKLSPIFQAMKQGRPVLIDEMNAIPHHVLIVLNDIINKRPGQEVFTPTGERIMVQEGFSVIGTGNWKPEDGNMYVGRQPIDIAFLARFGLEDYDFLPQATTFDALAETGDVEGTRKMRQKNELFRMMMVRLLDKQLGAKLPEDSFDKISRLAVAARILQDVLSGKNIDRAYFFHQRGSDVSPGGPDGVLKENVLSLRHLIPVLENWKKDGFVRELDDYIFLDYIRRSKARPQEMQYIYQVLKEQAGFFQEEDWPEARDDKELQKVIDYPIVKKMYGVDEMTGKENAIPEKELELKYHSPKEVIEVLFGPVPERKRFPKKILRPEKRGEADEAALLAEREKMEREERLKRLGRDSGGSIKETLGNETFLNPRAEKELKKTLFGEK